MPAELPERTPGVYVRDEDMPHELDMLWSSSKGYVREERSPVLIFVGGVVLGAILTSAVFLLLSSRPQINLGETQMTQPVSEEESIDAVPAAPAQPAENVKTGESLPNFREQSRTHTVQSGDTLGSIAIKYYGSSAPSYIEKLQRANNMSSPDSLQINQKLVIPPKNY